MVVDTKAALEMLRPKWSKYIPHRPTAKQALYLSLPHREALYGGAAGGGKSDALLMLALQYVDVPGHATLILRRTYTDLTMRSALIDRSMEWLAPTDAVWQGKSMSWVFPDTAATISFGYTDGTQGVGRYQGAEFQDILWDEVTQHYEENYAYLLSRCRKLVCSEHKLDAKGDPIFKDDCPECQIRKSVPTRVRCATNPPRAGDAGSTGWVQKRFDIRFDPDFPFLDPVTRVQTKGIYRGFSKLRPHVPAFITDNPHINQKDYIAGLAGLDPITREQLLRGNWGISADGRFRPSWLRRFKRIGDYVVLDEFGRGTPIHQSRLTIFTTVDPAASIKEGPGDARIWKQGAPSWTVITTFAMTDNYDLLLLDCDRFQREIPDIQPALLKNFNKWRPAFVGIEFNSFSIGVFQTALRSGLPVRRLQPQGDKLARANYVINHMANGKVFFPPKTGDVQQDQWLTDFEKEIFSWTAHPHEPDDQVDTLAYAGIIIVDHAGGIENLLSLTEAPEVY